MVVPSGHGCKGSAAGGTPRRRSFAAQSLQFSNAFTDTAPPPKVSGDYDGYLRPQLCAKLLPQIPEGDDYETCNAHTARGYGDIAGSFSLPRTSSEGCPRRSGCGEESAAKCSRRTRACRRSLGRTPSLSHAPHRASHGRIERSRKVGARTPRHEIKRPTYSVALGR